MNKSEAKAEALVEESQLDGGEESQLGTLEEQLTEQIEGQLTEQIKELQLKEQVPTVKEKRGHQL